MSTAAEHGRILLSAIIPDRRDLLDRALKHLTPEHFTDRFLRGIYLMLERYVEVTGAILTRESMLDMLHGARADAGKTALYTETYDSLAAATADEPAFRWSLDQLRELAAERATRDALVSAMEILNHGAEGERGETLKGHGEARTHALARFAAIDRDLTIQEAPEGDVRDEGDAILAEYAAGEAARLAGRSTGILTGIPALDEKTNGFTNGELILVVAFTGEGKALALDAPVLTSTGWRRMGDLRLGDEVVDPEGSHSQVTGVFPQGVLPVYRLTFSDGSTAEASGDHLWDIRYWKPVQQAGVQRQQRVRETWTTDQLRARVASKSRNPALVETPELANLDFPETDLPLDPYLLGLLLGDGALSCSTPQFSNPEPELIDAARAALPPGSHLVPSVQTPARCPRFLLSRTDRTQPNPVTTALVELGLRGHRSWEKFVPEQYKWASAKTRLAVLQGLMDTDGGRERGRAVFSSASVQLRDDVVWLARSLGLRAALLADKVPHFTYKGERRQGRVAYRCAIWETPVTRVFRLARKIKPVSAVDAGRQIVSVEYVRDAECQCIAVSAPSRLYVTNDFIPTHNTHFGVQLAHHAAVMQGKNVVFLTTETVRATVRRRLIARHSAMRFFDIAGGGLNSRDIKNYMLTREQKEQLHQVVTDSSKNPGYGHRWIAQVPRSATISHIESRLVRLQRMFHIDLVIVDSLYLLRPEKRRNTDREELSGILKEAKQLATTFNDGLGIPLVSPWQVSRSARQEADRTGFYTSQALSETAEASNSADIIISLLAPLDCDTRVVTLKSQVMKNRDGEKANAIEILVDYATSTFGAVDPGAGDLLTTDLLNFGP